MSSYNNSNLEKMKLRLVTNTDNKDQVLIKDYYLTHGHSGKFQCVYTANMTEALMFLWESDWNIPLHVSHCPLTGVKQ